MSDGMVCKWARAFKYGRKNVHDDGSVKTTVMQWLSHRVANFYDKGIKNLVVRYKCLNIGENYVEIQIKVWAFM